MSVRMAAAKLCACVCGGAVVGGGAVHLADRAQPRPHGVHKRVARPSPVVAARNPALGGTHIRRAAATSCATTQPLVAPASEQGVPLPIATPYTGPASFSTAGAGAPAVIGGNGGFGGGGFLSGGFLGGGGGSSGSGMILVATSTGTSGAGSSSSGGTGQNSAPGSSSTGGNVLTSNGGSGDTRTATSSGATGETSGGTVSGSGSPTSTGGSSSGSTNGSGSAARGAGNPRDPNAPPAPVPAPPMVWLFGAAAAALIVRDRLSRRGRFSADAQPVD